MRQNYLNRLAINWLAYFPLRPLFVLSLSTVFGLSVNTGVTAAPSEQVLVVGEYEVLIQKFKSDLTPVLIKIDNSTQSQIKQPLARVLWLPSEYGILPEEKLLAKQLAAFGIESWFVDYYEALFLAPTPKAVDQIPPAWTQKILALAKQDGLPLWVIAPNKAAQTAVRGLHALLQTPQQNLGLILVNPNLYLNTPAPGLEASYWPQVKQLNMPISILQAELSPWRWRLSSLANYFEQGGSDVFTLLQKQVRDRFYFRPDSVVIENELTKQLANKILQAMLLQRPYLEKIRQVAPLAIVTSQVVKQARSIELQDYSGQQNLPLSLESAQGNLIHLDAYKGKVVLVNFWASWCPPCVHEMPSMNRLKSHFKDQPFEILAVNLGEDRAKIEGFLRSHPVNFPILMDQQGTAVKQWKVFAYPSSYLIDKQGKIRFALFGATEWDLAGHLEKIESLLAQEPVIE
ncbi:MAG: hypothetical protein ISEC1_P1867 [Thiomicrorhabdus sp.]|nr:MAG: hypothetical protein ISEC1_P1867 [Thiomicrorhabdus sp.]